MNTWPLKPMGIGEILDQSFRFYRRNFVQLVLIALILYGSVMLLQNVISYDYSQMSFLPSGSIFEGEGFFNSITEMQGDPGIGRVLGSMLAGIIMLAFFPVMYSSVVVLVKSVMQGERPGLTEVLRGGFRNYWRLLGWSIVFGLIVVGIYIAVAMVFVLISLAGVAAAGAASTGAFKGLAVVGTLIFVVGVVLMVLAILGSISFFTVRLGFFLPLITVDNVSEVLSGSWRLTRGSFWRLLGIFLIVHIVIGVITYGFYFILIITMAFASIIGQLLLILSTVALYPLSMVAFAFTFFDLKARTEGADLQAMINATLPQPALGAGPRPEINMEG